MSGLGVFILRRDWPDDFGDWYVKSPGPPICVDDFGNLVHPIGTGYDFGTWLPQRDYFFRGEA